MRRSSPSLVVRAARVVRLALHLVRGLWIVRMRFPRLAAAGQDQTLQRWASELLRILGVGVRRHNAPPTLPERCLLVANHVSWLDIFAIYAAMPGLFVAKSDIRDWPVVGGLVAGVGTLFIERGNRRHARATNDRIVAALEAGRLVAVCPEGTTTDGRSLKHFHAALLQPAIDARAMVLPVALRYVDEDGAQSDAPVYVGETSLVESIWRVVSAPALAVELHFAPLVAADGLHRRELSQRTHEIIGAGLGLAPRRTAAGTGDGPRDAAPSAIRPTRSPYPAPADPA